MTPEMSSERRDQIAISRASRASLTTDYALAPSAQQEFDYPTGADNAFTTYQGCPTTGIVAGNQAVGQDCPAQHLLAGARGLLGHPLPVRDQPGVVVEEHEHVGPAAALQGRMGDEGSVQHVTDPDLVGGLGLEAAEDGRLCGQPRATEAAAREMAADGSG